MKVVYEFGSSLASQVTASAPSRNVVLSPWVNEPLPAWEELLSAHDVARLTRRPRWVLGEPRAPRPIPPEVPLSWPQLWLAALRRAVLADEGARGGRMSRGSCIDRAPTNPPPGILAARVRVSLRRASQSCAVLDGFPFASLIHPARGVVKDCMSTLWRNRSRQILLSFPPSVRFRMRSSRGSSACGMRRTTSVWIRTASTAKCVRGLNSCRLAHKVSRSIGLNSMRGRRTISVATGATWLKPKGASHGTQ